MFKHVCVGAGVCVCVWVGLQILKNLLVYLVE